MAADGNDGRPVSCPDCGGPVRLDREQLCPRCGYPLMYLRADAPAEPSPVPRAPGERDEPTMFLPPVPGPPRPPAPADTSGQLSCPRCRHPNPPSRVRCERCGEELRSSRTDPPGAPALTYPVVPRRNRRPLIVGVAVVTLLIVGGVLAAVRTRTDPSTPPNSDRSGSPEPTPPRLVAVAPAMIRAKASSTLPDERGITYGIENTLDGDRSTAWNSAGKRAGVTLTYRFATPIRLGRITVVDGYAKTAKLFAENARVARFSVRTDQGSRSWSLRDTPSLQTLSAELGRTRQVVLSVEKVYPGTKYDDLALTDITFYASS